MISGSKVFALDISEKALEVAKENAINNEADVTFIHDDILSLRNKIDTKFDIIVSNPPYVRELEKAGISAVVNSEVMWSLADTVNIFLVLPNTTALFKLKNEIE